MSTGQKYDEPMPKLMKQKKWDPSKIHLLLTEEERKIKGIDTFNALKDKYQVEPGLSAYGLAEMFKDVGQDDDGENKEEVSQNVNNDPDDLALAVGP